MVVLYAIISCDQPFFTLYFSVWEILRGFYSPFHSLSLYPFHLSLFLSLSLSFYLSLSPSLSLVSITLFGVSNGRFRPCLVTRSHAVIGDEVSGSIARILITTLSSIILSNNNDTLKV